MQLFGVASLTRLRVLEDEVCLHHSVFVTDTKRHSPPGFPFLPHSPRSETALMMVEAPCPLALVFGPSIHQVR